MKSTDQKADCEISFWIPWPGPGRTEEKENKEKGKS